MRQFFLTKIFFTKNCYLVFQKTTPYTYTLKPSAYIFVNGY
jgi:hypothetical protein